MPLVGGKITVCTHVMHMDTKLVMPREHMCMQHVPLLHEQCEATQPTIVSVIVWHTRT